MPRNLRSEREDIAQTISHFPCRQCDPIGNKTNCKAHARRCWSLYRKEAGAIQRRFTIPLRALNKRLRIFSLALALTCMCFLIFPPQHTKHHILEDFVYTIITDFQHIFHINNVSAATPSAPNNKSGRDTGRSM